MFEKCDSSNGIRTITPEENCSLVSVRVWVRVRVSFKVRGVIFLGAIVLELHQINSKNGWLLLSICFTAKFGLAFVLTLENAFS